MWSTVSIPCSTRRPRASRFALVAFGAAYPFIVYAGIGHVPPAAFVGLALAVLAIRAIGLRGEERDTMFSGVLATVGFGLLALLSIDGMVATKAYPVLMSLAFAAAFGWSLLFPPTLVERFAAMAGTVATAPARRYMRRVTLVWFFFLLANAGVSGWTALAEDPAVWALYNGLLSYLLMGLLMGGGFWSADGSEGGRRAGRNEADVVRLRPCPGRRRCRRRQLARRRCPDATPSAGRHGGRGGGRRRRRMPPRRRHLRRQLTCFSSPSSA